MVPVIGTGCVLSSSVLIVINEPDEAVILYHIQVLEVTLGQVRAVSIEVSQNDGTGGAEVKTGLSVHIIQEIQL